LVTAFIGSRIFTLLLPSTGKKIHLGYFAFELQYWEMAQHWFFMITKGNLALVFSQI